MVEELEVKKIPISLIKFDDTNPNILSKDQMNALKLTMEKFGYLAPVILNKDFTVVDGEHRVRIYQELDKKEIQAYVIDVDTIDLKILRQLMNKLKGTHDKQKDILEFKSIFDAGRLDEFSKLLAHDQQEMLLALEKKYDTNDLKFDYNPMDHYEDTFLHGNIKQIMIYFNNKEFEEIIPRIKQIMDKEGLKNNTKLFIMLLEYYENNRS